MPFKKGESGNPGGRSKDLPFKTALNMEIKAVADDDQRGLRKIARQLLEQAENGEPWAIKEVADRLDGKPSQSHALEHDVSDRFSEFLGRLDGNSGKLVRD